MDTSILPVSTGSGKVLYGADDRNTCVYNGFAQISALKAFMKLY